MFGDHKSKIHNVCIKYDLPEIESGFSCGSYGCVKLRNYGGENESLPPLSVVSMMKKTY